MQGTKRATTSKPNPRDENSWPHLVSRFRTYPGYRSADKNNGQIKWSPRRCWGDRPLLAPHGLVVVEERSMFKASKRTCWSRRCFGSSSIGATTRFGCWRASTKGGLTQRFFSIQMSVRRKTRLRSMSVSRRSPTRRSRSSCSTSLPITCISVWDRSSWSLGGKGPSTKPNGTPTGAVFTEPYH